MESNILLASEGRPFSAAAIDKAVELAGKHGKIHVLSIARIWGTALGFPNPWLLPSRHEWTQQRDQVAAAVAALKVRGYDVQANVIGTRNASKRINAEAARLNCNAIVMGADAPRHWTIIDLFWSQEPYRVRKKAKVPVHLVL